MKITLFIDYSNFQVENKSPVSIYLNWDAGRGWGLIIGAEWEIKINDRAAAADYFCYCCALWLIQWANWLEIEKVEN